MVQRALEELDYDVVEGGKVRGHGNDQTNADLVVRMDGSYDVGFTQNRDGEVVMVADMWGLRIDRQSFLNQITQRYAYHTVLEQAEAQGFRVTGEEVQQDGSVRLVMHRW
jgi:hypothetical protein